jgi:hypothetical protein
VLALGVLFKDLNGLLALDSRDFISKSGISYAPENCKSWYIGIAVPKDKSWLSF